MDDKAKASREAYWSELDDSGKIERLRIIMKEQQNLISRMAEYLYQLVEHKHLDGKMVTKIKNPNEKSCGGFRFYKRSPEFF